MVFRLSKKFVIDIVIDNIAPSRDRNDSDFRKERIARSASNPPQPKSGNGRNAWLRVKLQRVSFAL